MDSDERNAPEAVLSPPPAHHQLLSCDPPAFADLKGYDHTLQTDPAFQRGGDVESDHDTGYDVGYDIDETLLYPAMGFAGHDDTFSFASSWLLGFAGKRAKRAEGDATATAATPGLVRVPSSERMSESGDESVSSISSSPSASPTTKPAKKGVSFASSVKVQPIPHSSSLSPSQRRAMYTSSWEIRRNRSRNKKEWRYDDCDWLAATEEEDMAACEATGELVHPAHQFG